MVAIERMEIGNLVEGNFKSGDLSAIDSIGLDSRQSVVANFNLLAGVDNNSTSHGAGKSAAIYGNSHGVIDRNAIGRGRRAWNKQTVLHKYISAAANFERSVIHITNEFESHQ